MIQLAIVEDRKEDRESFFSAIYDYQKRKNVDFEVSSFMNGLDFLENGNRDFDIVFLDIEMPFLNGMELAKKIREKKGDYLDIVFISYSAQYAVKGYSVDAIGYIVKPIRIPNFDSVVDKCVDRVNKRRKAYVVLPNKEGMTKVSIFDIVYLEVRDHDLYFYTLKDTFRIRESLKKYKVLLEPYRFYQCNSCYLINLKYVKNINGNSVDIGDSNLQISRSKKKGLQDAFYEYIGDTI